MDNMCSATCNRYEMSHIFKVCLVNYNQQNKGDVIVMMKTTNCLISFLEQLVNRFPYLDDKDLRITYNGEYTGSTKHTF